jgi:diaminopimelate decarboxylase
LELLVGSTLAGLIPDELASRFGTPFYVYDLDVVTSRTAALRAALPRRVDVAYAVKANPALAVVAHMRTLGLGVDIASAGELELVTKAGVPPEGVVFTGPGKRDDELRRAVRAGIRALTVESPDELERLERIAAEEQRVVPVMLRAAVSPGVGAERVRLVGDEGAGKFGIDPADLLAVARLAVRSPHLEPLGVHVFSASNVLDAEVLARHSADTADLGREIAASAGFHLRLVDVGGGLGIPYRPDDPHLDIRDLGRRFAVLLDRLTRDPVARDVRLVLEPGRYLIGPAGAYVARVIERKIVAGRHIAVLDGGINHVLRPALVREEHSLRVLGRDHSDTDAHAPVTVAGPLCSGHDILSANAAIPIPRRDDLVAVLDVGAYGYTESMPFFLSHPTPAEVAVRGGHAELIRRRIEPSELLGLQRLPHWPESPQP